jgi:outer membrane protein, adhesin transport system
MNIQIVYAVSAVALLSACGNAPRDMADMQNVITERLAGDHQSSVSGPGNASIDLNRGFAPALLGAVNADAGYLSAVALEREAFDQVGVAASIRRLQLSAGANLGAVRSVGAGGSNTAGVAGGINLSQLVYDGGASASAINRSTALALSAQADRRARSNDILLRAASAWIDVWQYSERLRLMNQRTSEISTVLDQIERMASNGMLDRASVDSARRKIVEIELEEASLQASYAEADVRFRHFFRVSSTSVSRPAELVSAEGGRQFAADWRNAPALQRQAAEMLAAQASVAEAEAAFRPRARLQAGARSPLERSDPIDLTVGLSLEYVFSDGGRRQRQLDASTARFDAMAAQLSDAQRGLEAELQASLTRLASIERSMPLIQEKLRLSQSEAETSRSQLMTGQSNLRQLIEAEIEMYRAQDQQIAMSAERQVLLMTIAANTGALSVLIGLQE